MTAGLAPLILLPGLLCDARLWRHQVAALSDVCQATVADLTRDDSVDGMARTVLDHAPRRFALAGLSMGGYVALAVARMAPERIERLALLDTSARADTAERIAARQRLDTLARSGRFDEIPPLLLPALVHPSRLAERALTAAILDMAHAVGGVAFLRQHAAIMGRPDGRPGLPAIRCPTLVLCGREDQRTPVALHVEMAAAIPDARLVVLEECGHMSTMERGDEVARAMRNWLAAKPLQEAAKSGRP